MNEEEFRVSWDKKFYGDISIRCEIHDRWSKNYNLSIDQSIECEVRAKDELNGYNLGELYHYMEKENIVWYGKE